MSIALVRITYPSRHAGVVLCRDHLSQLRSVELRRSILVEDLRTEVIEDLRTEDVASHGHRCIMCGVAAVPDRRCEYDRCRRPLHPQWPAVYCCNDCALEDV